MPRRDTDTGAGRKEASTEPSDDGTLGGLRRTETIADLVDFAAVRRDLPDEWDVRPDLVQFGPEPLSETIRFRRTLADPQLVLKLLY